MHNTNEAPTRSFRQPPIPGSSAVIFDVDGTVADTERDGHRLAFDAAFETHGLDITWGVEEYGRLLAITGGRRRIAADRCARGFGDTADELADRIHQTKTALFRDRILAGDLMPRPGLLDLVTSLVEAGIRIAVATTGRRAWSSRCWAHLLGDGIVETAVTGDDVVRLKPHPEVYLRALDKVRLSAQQALAVEDSANSLLAATRAGLATVVVTTGYTRDQDFTGAAMVRSGYDGIQPLLAATCTHCLGEAAQRLTPRRNSDPRAERRKGDDDLDESADVHKRWMDVHRASDEYSRVVSDRLGGESTMNAPHLAAARRGSAPPCARPACDRPRRRIVTLSRPHAGGLACAAVLAATATLTIPTAHADNKRLNDGVVADVYTVQHQAGCTNDVKINPQLQLAAQWHTLDVLNNRNLDSDLGSDGSTAQSRAEAAGYRGTVAETVAINPALAISGIELINQWYYNPAYMAIMSNCANTQIGVWSENSLDRTVVVAVYGQPQVPVENRPLGPEVGLPSPVALQQNVPLDPSPDYDASDEIEYGIDWFPWILRGVYPPPAYPPE